MQDEIHVSTGLWTEEGAEFLQAISETEVLVNTIYSACSQEMYQIASEAINLLTYGNVLHKWHENVDLWVSCFSGIQVIVNRVTPAHRDTGGCAQAYDLLVSAGTHTSANIHIHDVQANMTYSPGTVVLVCGRVLRHEVSTWHGGERICIAHYIHDNVHERLGLPRPDWVTIDTYRHFMEPLFQLRQGY